MYCTVSSRSFELDLPVLGRGSFVVLAYWPRRTPLPPVAQLPFRQAYLVGPAVTNHTIHVQYLTVRTAYSVQCTSNRRDAPLI